MPKNFLSVVAYVFAIAAGLALLITLIAFSATIFALAFIYIFVPLFIFAGIRYLWLRYKYRGYEKITFIDDDKR